mmetsp:Transcript_101349/g.321926  ORF Transcript_101349/g.321926 Transcript_101349/m.321926 type:complete len:329 (-) Transcript_101349:879-1865(-)
MTCRKTSAACSGVSCRFLSGCQRSINSRKWRRRQSISLVRVVSSSASIFVMMPATSGLGAAAEPTADLASPLPVPPDCEDPPPPSPGGGREDECPLESALAAPAPRGSAPPALPGPPASSSESAGLLPLGGVAGPAVVAGRGRALMRGAVPADSEVPPGRRPAAAPAAGPAPPLAAPPRPALEPPRSSSGSPAAAKASAAAALASRRFEVEERGNPSALGASVDRAPPPSGSPLQVLRWLPSGLIGRSVSTSGGWRNALGISSSWKSSLPSGPVHASGTLRPPRAGDPWPACEVSSGELVDFLPACRGGSRYVTLWGAFCEFSACHTA